MAIRPEEAFHCTPAERKAVDTAELVIDVFIEGAVKQLAPEPVEKLQAYLAELRQMDADAAADGAAPAVSEPLPRPRLLVPLDHLELLDLLETPRTVTALLHRYRRAGWSGVEVVMTGGHICLCLTV